MAGLHVSGRYPYLNPEAAKLAAEITKLIGKMVWKIPKLKPFAPLIKAYCKLKANWIKEVGEDYGCKLVSRGSLPACSSRSPWRRGRTPTCGDRPRARPGLERGRKVHRPPHSKSNPALAVFNGKL
jgi:hypothetical protein